MPKLHLKRTPEEEAQHRLRKEKKRAKRKRRHTSDRDYEAANTSRSHKRHHGDRDISDSHSHRKWASSDEDEEEYGPQPAGSTSKSYKYQDDYEAARTELEEELFREKMFDALGDDERLDGLEARLNDFTHVPDRWRTASSKQRGRVLDSDEFDDLLKLDPQAMDEEEYTEWIRLGMYRSVFTVPVEWMPAMRTLVTLYPRKTHAKEYEEQQQRKAARAAREAEAKARRKEAERLEEKAREEDKLKRRKRESQKMEYARQEYHSRWKGLLALNGKEIDVEAVLHFDDIPWPIVAAHRQKPKKKRGAEPPDTEATQKTITVEDLTAEAISAFILPLVSADTSGEEDDEKAKKVRKEKLRETFLRFHPDKFEGRFMGRVRESDREKVREGIGQVSRVLNTLLGKEA